MIKKYSFGRHIPSYATVKEIAAEKGLPGYFRTEEAPEKICFSFRMEKEDAVFGLGEQTRGINKRGWSYTSRNTDDNVHTENKTSLYGAHNFFVVSGKRTFGAFFDCPGEIAFDIGYTDTEVLSVSLSRGFDLYIVDGGGILEIVKEFRGLIGQSYIPPKWAFGFGQSRWGYTCEEDIRQVAEGYRREGMSLDCIYLDIDYMEGFKDFTVSRERFPEFERLVSDMKSEGIRLVLIIDAAVKVEKGYSVYEEGIKNGYFCKDEEGNPYVVGVWPGDSVLPDVLNTEAREWFGGKYRTLLDMGIEGFWNDMNEPAIFYSKKRFSGFMENFMPEFAEEYFRTKENGLPIETYNHFKDRVKELENNAEDYAEFYHDADGTTVSHAEVHNLYGYHMTKAAAEYFRTYNPDKRYLLFSRSSSIGMHRYGGVWTGDNASWWTHILLNLKQLPSLNMCGFLYVGADLGGFMYNVTEDLLLRWFALGIFVPLMRNHSALGTRAQECYRFKNKETFKNFLDIRYGLIPYLYSEYVRCALNGDMLFKPLSFVYTEDERAKATEDQLLFGESLMIAPVYEQNAIGRYVYLPERMKLVRMTSTEHYTEEILERGDWFIPVALDEIVFFIREGKVLPLAGPGRNADEIDEDNLRWVKFIEQDTVYRILRDDGYSLKDIGEKFVAITVKK